MNNFAQLNRSVRLNGYTWKLVLHFTDNFTIYDIFCIIQTFVLLISTREKQYRLDDTDYLRPVL